MRIIILLLFAAFLWALPQLGDTANILPDVAHGAEEGTIAVFLTPDLAGRRKEVYLGETLWLVAQIKTAHSPCPFSVEVVDVETGEVVLRRSDTFNICGGRMLGDRYYTLVFPYFKIEEPVVEGRRFKIVVRAGNEWGAYTFTERHNPPAGIVSISFFEGGRVVTVLREGGEYQLVIKVKNEGEGDGRLHVGAFDQREEGG